MACDDKVARLVDLIRVALAPHVGRAEYGSPLWRVDAWDAGEAVPTTCITIGHEVGNGSTRHLSISFDPATGMFEADGGQGKDLTTGSLETAMEWVNAWIQGIPPTIAAAEGSSILRRPYTIN